MIQNHRNVILIFPLVTSSPREASNHSFFCLENTQLCIEESGLLYTFQNCRDSHMTGSDTHWAHCEVEQSYNSIDQLTSIRL